MNTSKIVTISLITSMSFNSASFAMDIHKAAEAGDCARVQQLLRDGVDVNAQAQDGQPPLHKAAGKGNVAVAQLLCQHRANVDAQANNGFFPLHYAAKDGHKAVAQLLLKRGADVNANTQSDAMYLGEIPLWFAAFHGHADIARLLLRYGARVGNIPHCIPVHLRSQNAIDIINRLLSDLPRYNSFNSVFFAMGIHKAAKEGNLRRIQGLLQSGFNVDARDKDDKNTPLHYAAEGDQVAIAQLLLNAGADVNARNMHWRATPLHKAAISGSVAVARLLLSRRANVNAKNRSDETPLHWAAGRGNVDVARLLLEHGAAVNAMALVGTPLHVAAERGHAHVARLLLQHKANVDADQGRVTPLHSAAENGHAAVVRVLLQYGADIDAENTHGETPFSKATYYNHTTVTQLLDDWPFYEAFTLLQKEDQTSAALAFLMASHPRLGVASPARVLDDSLCRFISTIVCSPCHTLEEIHQIAEQARGN